MEHAITPATVAGVREAIFNERGDAILTGCAKLAGVYGTDYVGSDAACGISGSGYASYDFRDPSEAWAKQVFTGMNSGEVELATEYLQEWLVR